MSRTDTVNWLNEWWLPVSPRAGLAGTLGFGVLIWLAWSAKLMGLFLAWVLLFGLSRYLVNVLIARAAGESWPVPDAASFNPFHEARRFGIAVLAVATVVLAHVLAPLGSVPALVAILLLVALPAMLALSAVDLDPMRWFDVTAQSRLIGRLGRHYVVLLLQWLALVLILPLISRQLDGPLFFATFIYAYVFLHSSVGGLLYRQRERIGLDVARAPETRKNAFATSRRARLAQPPCTGLRLFQSGQ